MLISVLDRIDLYGLMADVLVQEPNVYHRIDRQYSRCTNDIFSHRTPFVIFSIMGTADHYSIATKERKSWNDNWTPVYRIRIPKDD